MKLLAVIVVLCSITGCAQWPDHGFGGVAEIRPDSEVLSAEGNLIARKLTQVESYLDVLATVGAQACLPGQVKLLRNKLTQVSRETYSGYYADARTHLHEATRAVKTLQCQLQAVQRQTNCSMNKSTATTLDRWYLNVNYSDCTQLDALAATALLTNDILFATGKAELTPIAKSNLDKWIKHLSQFKTTHLEIIGHTDSRGDILENDQLSNARANAVAKYIARHGIARERLSIKYYGEFKPRTLERDEHELQLNRRVSLQINTQGEDDVSL